MYKHLLSFAVIALALVLSGQTVLAQSGNAVVDIEAGTITINGQVKVMSEEMKAMYRAKQVMLEEMRKGNISEAQVRKAAAEAKGDNAAALLEAKKLKLEEYRAQMDAKRETLRVEFEAKKASTTARKIEWSQDIAEHKVAVVTRIISATIDRLERIIERVESRITKIKAAGGDTAESERYVAEAKVNITNAEASVVAFANIDLSSDDAQENFGRVRAAVAGTKEIIRLAHQNLMLAVRSLSALDVDVEVEATVN